MGVASNTGLAAARMRPANAVWGVTNFKNTRGGIVSVFGSTFKGEKQDQYGETEVNMWGFGIAKCEATLSVADMTAAKMATLTGGATTPGGIGTPDTVKVSATSFIGTSMRALAQALKIYPIINGIQSAYDQIRLPLAFPSFDITMNFSETAQAMKATFTGLPDDTSNNELVWFTDV
jgi:hypothetical protein